MEGGQSLAGIILTVCVDDVQISFMHSTQETRCFIGCSCLQGRSKGINLHSILTEPSRRQRRRQQRCAARHQTEEDITGAHGSGSPTGEMSGELMPHAPAEVLCHAEDAAGERSRNRVIEDELRDPSNFLE